jgi:Potassium-transporting ATPase A subunit
MTWQGWFQILIYVGVLTALTPLLGGYMARVYMGRRVVLERVLGPVERGFYRAVRTDPAHEQDWKQYGRTVLVFSALCWLALYAILRLQGALPFNPLRFDGRHGTSPSTPRRRSSPTPTGSTTAARRPCRSSPRWPGWRCRTSSRPRSAWRSSPP